MESARQSMADTVGISKSFHGWRIYIEGDVLWDITVGYEKWLNNAIL